MRSTGKVEHQHSNRRLLPLAEIAESINEAEESLDALIHLLTQVRGDVSALGIARLLQPHHLAIRRAAMDLTDQA